MTWVDLVVREHKKGKIKLSDNGSLVDVIARVIVKFNIRREVLQKVEELQNPAPQR